VKLYAGALDTQFTIGRSEIAEDDKVVTRWSVRGRYEVASHWR